MNRFFCILSISSLLGFHSLQANGPIEDKVPFQFDGPEVLKIDWNTNGLRVEDVNGDGLNDIAFVNRERSRIQIHYRRKTGELPNNVKPSRQNRWEPVLEDAPYVQENISTSTDVASITFGDFDGDKQLDLAYGSREAGVFVHFREKDSFTKEPLEIEVEDLRAYHGCIMGKDMDGDGTPELLVHVKRGLQVYQFDKRASAPNPQLYKDNSEGSVGLYFADINGDGKEDWLYKSFGSDYGIRTRLRTNDGFGPELSLRFRPGGELIPLACGSHGYNNPSFVTIESNSLQVALFEVSNRDSDSTEKRTMIPQVENVFATDNNVTSFSFEDFTGDGLKDIAAATASEPSVQLFRGQKDGNFSFVGTFPSLSDISQLAAGHFSSGPKDKAATLVVLSTEEKLVGLTRFEGNQRFRFPKAISLKDEPVAIDTCDLDKDNHDEILVVTKERYDFTLRRYVQNPDGKFEQSIEIELDGFKRSPTGIFPCDLNGDGHLDLLVLSARNPAMFLQGDGKGGLTEAAKDSAVRKSLLSELAPNRIAMADIDGDQREELLVSGTGFVRAVTMNGDELEVIDQFNARSSKDQLLSPFSMDVTGDKTPELLFYVPEGRFDVLSKAKDGVYRFLQSHEVAPFPLQHLDILPAKGNRPSEILAFGKHTFQRIPTKPSNPLPTLKVLHRFQSDIRDIQHRGVDTGDFNSDGRPDLFCIDPSKNLIEFFRLSEDEQEWESVLHFQIFEKNLHVRGERSAQPEPREGVVADLNGDGKDDLVLLVHDRLLHYYQK